MTGARFITDLASGGRHHFTTEEAREALGSSLVAARATLRRLKAKGDIASPVRGFHVIVPPEYRSLSCLPPEQFIPALMENGGEPYYAGLLTAAQFHGAAHQRPQVFQVVVRKNRPDIRCGKIHVVFVARRNTRQVPTAPFNTPRGSIAVSTAEATAIDLVTYADRCGGLDAIATVLSELAEVIDPARLARLAARMEALPVAQRLGWLLDLVGQGERAEPLARLVARRATNATPLLASTPMRGAPRDPRWRVAVNVDVETDL